jgi:hypothetical protein
MKVCGVTAKVYSRQGKGVSVQFKTRDDIECVVEISKNASTSVTLKLHESSLQRVFHKHCGEEDIKQMLEGFRWAL